MCVATLLSQSLHDMDPINPSYSLIIKTKKHMYFEDHMPLQPSYSYSGFSENKNEKRQSTNVSGSYTPQASNQNGEL